MPERTMRPVRLAIAAAMLSMVGTLDAGPSPETPRPHRDASAASAAVVITRSELIDSGALSVAEFLRGMPQNSFGSARPQQGLASSLALLDLRGLGPHHTLVLIDGRRALPDPTAEGATNLNHIPIAAVERIEVTPPGASAQHGSGASGGVVNIVMRRELQGAELSYGIGRPTARGGDTEHGAASFGIVGEQGALTTTVAFDRRDRVMMRDRDWHPELWSSFANNFRVAMPDLFAPGRHFVYGLLSHPQRGAVPPGGCTGPDLHLVGPVPAVQRCLYDLRAVSADDVALARHAVLTRADLALAEATSLYLDASITRVQAHSTTSPAPTSTVFPIIPAGSPNHPAVRFPEAGYQPAQPLALMHRFTALGPRTTHADQVAYDIATGVRTDFDAARIEFGVRSAEVRHQELTRNLVVHDIAERLIASGAYDIYAPASTPREVLDSMRATRVREAGSRLRAMHAAADFDLVALAGRHAVLRTGIERRLEHVHEHYDPLSSSGQPDVPRPGFPPVDRRVTAGWATLDVPLHAAADFSLTARHERVSDLGSELSRGAVLTLRPADSLRLRIAHSIGHDAAPMQVVHVVPTRQTVEYSRSPWHPCPPPFICDFASDAYRVANPALSAERARTTRAGFDWLLAEGVGLTLETWDIRIDRRITLFHARQVLRCMLGEIPCPRGVSQLPATTIPGSPGLGAGLQPDGTPIIHYGMVNAGTLDARGLDLDVHASASVWSGALSSRLRAGYIQRWRLDGRDLVGNEGRPMLRATWSSRWAHGPFELGWNVHHVHRTLSAAGERNRSPSHVDEYLPEPHHLPSWNTHDVQLSWHGARGRRFEAGVLNLTDRDPPVDPLAPTGRDYRMALYDAYGRTPYLRWVQMF